LRLDGRFVPCETLVTRVGADVVVVETTVPTADLGLSITSTYLNQQGIGVLAGHALAGVALPSLLWQRRIEEGDEGLGEEPLVLDHLFQLQEQLSAQGLVAQITLDDAKHSQPTRG
jgi:hypothetical protein